MSLSDENARLWLKMWAWTEQDAGLLLSGEDPCDYHNQDGPHFLDAEGEDVHLIRQRIRDFADPSLFGPNGLAPAKWIELAAFAEIPIPTSLTNAAEQLGAGSSPDAPEAERPLATRERRTYSVIFAALAKMANLDLSEPYKAGGIIAAQAETMGLQLGGKDTGDKIKEILEAMPEALEARRR